MLNCFTQQLLAHEEKCSFLVWQSYTDDHSLHIPSIRFRSPSCLLWHSWEELASTWLGKSVLSPSWVYSGSVSKPTAYTLCMCACLKEPRLNVNHQLPSGGWELSGKQLTVNGRLMSTTAGGPMTLLFREQWETVLQNVHVLDAPVFSYSLCTSVGNCQ